MYRVSNEEVIEVTANEGLVCDTKCEFAGRICCVLCKHYTYQRIPDKFACLVSHEVCDASGCDIGKNLLKRFPFVWRTMDRASFISLSLTQQGKFGDSNKTWNEYTEEHIQECIYFHDDNYVIWHNSSGGSYTTPPLIYKLLDCYIVFLKIERVIGGLYLYYKRFPFLEGCHCLPHATV